MSAMVSAQANFAELVRGADQALRNNEYEKAEQLYRTALTLQADNASALARLGLALHEQKRFHEAEAIFLRLTELSPREASYWMNVGTARRCAGELEQALYAFARAAALGANSADFYYNVALAHVDRNDFEAARGLLKKAFDLAPNDAEVRYRYALCCYECLQMEEALAALEGWTDSPSVDQTVGADIGHLLLQLGEPGRAEPAVRRAATPDNPRARFTLGQVLERTNRIDEAERIASELAADPIAAKALGSDLTLLQAQLAQRREDHETAVRLFREVLQTTKELHERHYLEFPLAKSLDALKRYDEAFSVLNDAHRSQLAYLQRSSPRSMVRGAPTLVIAERSANLEDVKRWNFAGSPHDGQSPIFIVAFPRSGTTLLELTLDAHPALVSMDEQPFLQNALDDILSLGVRYPAQLAGVTDEQLESVRANYWKKVSRKVELQRDQRLVDKNPLNMLRLPLIKRLFPHSPVILAVRHPCDVILSCFMQHFRAPDFVLLCKDLPTLAAGYRKTFDFWYLQQEILSPHSLEVRYENFVSDFEPQTRAIFEFLGLPWDAAALEPGKRALAKRFVSTPSYTQVVQPVTKKAVGRWQNYREHFEQCLPILRPYLDRWGYES
jgi:Flp pilus assembly protein TadD